MKNLEYRQTLIDMRSGTAQDLQTTIETLCKEEETSGIDLLHYTTSLKALEDAGILTTDKKVRLLLVAPGGFSFEDAEELQKKLKRRSNMDVRVLESVIHEQKIHTKLCILKRRDNKDLVVLGSANFSGAGHGLNMKKEEPSIEEDIKKTNIELSVLLFANDAIRQHFEHFWKIAQEDFNPNLFDPYETCHEALIEKAFQSPIHRLLKYQEDVVKQLGALYRGKGPGALLSLPTGSGKTVTVLRFLAEHVLRDDDSRKPILWLSHIDGLNRQSLGAAHDLLSRVAPQVRIQTESEYVQYKDYPRYCAELQDLDLVFNMPKTEKKKPFSKDGYSCIVVDGAHYGSGIDQDLAQVLDENATTFRLGITATPYRTDRESVFDRFGKKLIPNPLLDRGDLLQYDDPRFGPVKVLAKISESDYKVHEVPFKVKWDAIKGRLESDDRLKEFGNLEACKGVAEAWKDTYGQTLVFAIDTEHANKLAKAFRHSHGQKLKLQVTHSKTLSKGLNLVVETP